MRLVLIFFLFVLVACQSTEQVVLPKDNYLNDDDFSDHVLYPVETEHDIFSLDESALEFIRDLERKKPNTQARLKAMVKAIFDSRSMDMLYSSNANTTAMETFHNRAANCLSLSIMTYALAKKAGYEVTFNDVEIPEYWTRNQGFSMLNGHVNLTAKARNNPNEIQLLNRPIQIDFDPQDMRKHFPIRRVNRQVVMAMFYNNKGADALVANSYTKAYAYFRAAAKIAPQFDSTWVNLGVLYRMTGHFDWADRVYHLALELDSDNYTAWENLAVLYNYNNREVEAELINKRIAKKRASNPFYHYILGEQALEDELVDEAIKHFRRGLRADNKKHELYFGLAKAYALQGEDNLSVEYLRKARRLAGTKKDQKIYQGKLDLISRL